MRLQQAYLAVGFACGGGLTCSGLGAVPEGFFMTSRGMPEAGRVGSGWLGVVFGGVWRAWRVRWVRWDC